MVGKFITFEGGEGAGKSVSIQRVKENFEKLGYDVIVTREPGGTSVSEQLREVLVNKENTGIDVVTEMYILIAARNEHLVNKIIPALESGKIVLCDRFVDSSLVYQGHVGELGIEYVFDKNMDVIGDCIPDLTLYFDLDPEIGLSRISKNKDREVNRFDLKKLDYHLRVREGYLRVADMFSDRIKKVDASLSIDEVVEEVTRIVSERLL